MEELVTKMTADFLKSLAHPARIRILKMLGPGERCVCDLSAEIDIEQSNLSQHLSILKKQGLIGSRKEGTKVIYRILYPSVLEVINLVEETLSQQISHSQSLLKHLK
ncbi:transcriptional regulator, ArsR family [Thermosinus carboxydivorans Nor1]|uniref:Transcriptional regulator, ArsR family n=1 Tax=Thermosinus carboxydivorans Nor1 TaxID=401526 RepID=A1HQT0_9FIRM|nr:metalloregulator ArsR/SmtB family transcription factor [Thermosinus carboxydivorans]EAX47641.1 transcriptional regulator, ArsR family [Thermosinus carboxydivorans Nor1]